MLNDLQKKETREPEIRAHRRIRPQRQQQLQQLHRPTTAAPVTAAPATAAPTAAAPTAAGPTAVAPAATQRSDVNGGLLRM